MGRHSVGRAGDLSPGQRKIVELEGRSIGIFNVHGSYYALRNRCPHQAAPLCLGAVKGMTLPSAPGEYVWARDGEILRCPWHGWEFDITNGRSICNPHKTLVKTYAVTVEPDEERVDSYPVTVEDGLLVVHL
jgi:nitrite reductase/ring-hydroxylating ferredoxin subunit